MAARKFAAYYRCSPARQDCSGFGLEAQRKAVHGYLTGGAWELIAERTEVEVAKLGPRPELEQALSLCRLKGATLIIAKMDRLSRNLTFLSALLKSGVRFVAADMPEANETRVHLMVVIAQVEGEVISRRTREALAAAKARGVKLGGIKGSLGDLAKARAVSAAVRGKASTERAEEVRGRISAAQAEGASSLREIAAALDLQGTVTPRGGKWSATQVRRILPTVPKEPVEV